MYKKPLLFSILIFLVIILLPVKISAESNYSTEIVTGRVVSIQDLPVQENQEGLISKIQIAEVEIISGNLRGEKYSIQNSLTGHPLYDIEMQPEQEIYLLVERMNGEILSVSLNDYVRDTKIYWLAAIFAAIMLAVGRIKGLKALISLSLTLVLIITFLLPQILLGGNPILLSVILSVTVTGITLLLIGGWNGKTGAAALGTTAGVVIAGGLALVMGTVAHLTGFSSEEAQMLQFAEIAVDVRGLLFAGIIIGSLGAVMDVAVSISSTCSEVKKANPSLGWKDIFSAGLNVGRDVMGTMTNTLILAYTGSSLPLMLLFMVNDFPISRIINADMIATEIVRSLTGTIGLITTIPLTALLAALFQKKQQIDEQ